MLLLQEEPLKLNSLNNALSERIWIRFDLLFIFLLSAHHGKYVSLDSQMTVAENKPHNSKFSGQ